MYQNYQHQFMGPNAAAAAAAAQQAYAMVWLNAFSMNNLKIL